MQITAAVLRDKAQPFHLENVELDAPRADEVLVRLVATGICHTDLSMREAPFNLPVVLGHEGAGVVEQVGARVAKVKPGDHVVLTFSSCGGCPNCQRGQPAYCAHAFDSTFTGKRADGSSTLQQGGRNHSRLLLWPIFLCHLRLGRGTQCRKSPSGCAIGAVGAAWVRYSNRRRRGDE